MVLTHYVPVAVEHVSNHSHNNPFVPVYPDSSIIEVCQCLDPHARSCRAVFLFVYH